MSASRRRPTVESVEPMPVSHLASLRHRVIVVVLAGALALGLAVVGVVVTVPAASSTPRTVASAPQPGDVAAAVVGRGGLGPGGGPGGGTPRADRLRLRRLDLGPLQRRALPPRGGLVEHPRAQARRPGPGPCRGRRRVREPGAGRAAPATPSPSSCRRRWSPRRSPVPGWSSSRAGAPTPRPAARAAATTSSRTSSCARPSSRSWPRSPASAAPTPARWWWSPGDRPDWRRTGTGSPRSSATRRTATASRSSTRPACSTWDTTMEDGVHPNRAGNEALARAITRQGRLQDLLRLSLRPAH